jgi:hypothetical protein
MSRQRHKWPNVSLVVVRGSHGAGMVYRSRNVLPKATLLVWALRTWRLQICFTIVLVTGYTQTQKVEEGYTSVVSGVPPGYRKLLHHPARSGKSAFSHSRRVKQGEVNSARASLMVNYQFVLGRRVTLNKSRGFVTTVAPHSDCLIKLQL